MIEQEVILLDGTTPVRISTATVDREGAIGAHTVAIQNIDGGACYIGGEGLSPTNYGLVTYDQIVVIDLDTNEVLYACVDDAVTNTVSVLRTSVNPG